MNPTLLQSDQSRQLEFDREVQSVAPVLAASPVIHPGEKASHEQFIRYWEEFYRKAGTMPPSKFSLAVGESFLQPKSRILEFGCGNGRDAFHFASLGHEVTGVDLSITAIEACRRLKSSARFIHADFSTLLLDQAFDVVYSRFTLHSVDATTERRALANAARHLKPGGRLMIEARTIYDELCGRGERISDSEWIYNDHYRRFLDPVEFLQDTRWAQFVPTYLLMGQGLAPWESLDPVVIRLVLRKVG